MKVLEAPNVCASLLLFAPASEKACVALVDLYEEYVDQFGANLKRFGDTMSETAHTFGPQDRQYPRQVLLPTRRAYSFHAHDGGPKPRGFYWLGALSTEAKWPVYFKASWDMSVWSGDWNGLSRFAERAASRFDYLSAYAGLSFAQLFMLSYSARTRATITSRYRCVDWDELFALQFAAYEGVRSPAWLTMVGRPFLSRLSPSPGDASLLGISVSRVGDGYMFRAGEAPILGDVNDEEDISVYHTVGRYLRPAAMNRDGEAWSNGGDNGWAARFDK